MGTRAILNILFLAIAQIHEAETQNRSIIFVEVTLETQHVVGSIKLSGVTDYVVAEYEPKSYVDLVNPVDKRFHKFGKPTLVIEAKKPRSEEFEAAVREAVGQVVLLCISRK